MKLLLITSGRRASYPLTLAAQLLWTDPTFFSSPPLRQSVLQLRSSCCCLQAQQIQPASHMWCSGKQEERASINYPVDALDLSMPWLSTFEVMQAALLHFLFICFVWIRADVFWFVVSLSADPNERGSEHGPMTQPLFSRWLRLWNLRPITWHTCWNISWFLWIYLILKSP